MRYPVIVAIALVCASPVFAQAPKGNPGKTTPAPTAPTAPDAQDTPNEPTLTAMPVPGLQIASHPNLVIEAIDIGVSVDRVTHTYRFRNKGTEPIQIAASLDLPKLTASADGSEAYRVATENPENPIGLTISVDGAPVTAKADVRAYALNIDRAADLRALNVPLVPFGAQNDKALAALSADQSAKLVALGLISPSDPSQPNILPFADWTLSVTYGWDQTFAPQKTTTIAISFKPVAGSFDVTKENASILDDIKDESCLQPATIKALKARVQAKNATPIPVTEIVLSNESPARWIENPAAMVTIDKTAPDVVVAFCGTNTQSASPTRLIGKAPDDADTIRVLMFGTEVN